ncbi:MAG TPA: hypothetical protein VGT61_08440 [Thermomicrobiales bacterium]|jgi:hypothetical protein|nr:hypothetical protein [Thermomicrobiales bacterium]
MSDNGRHDPVTHLFIVSKEPEANPVDDAYEALLELDRLEELLEAMNELGVSTRVEAEALPPGPGSVEVIAEMDALGVSDAAQIERRLAELEGSLDDE